MFGSVTGTISRGQPAECQVAKFAVKSVRKQMFAPSVGPLLQVGRWTENGGILNIWGALRCQAAGSGLSRELLVR